MAKKTEDKLEELEHWKTEKEIEDGIKEGIDKWVRRVCVTAVSTAMSVFYFLGEWAYNHAMALKAAIDALLAALRNGQ